MARPLRIEYPGAFYHVINRGLEKREIYRTDKDREYFLELLEHLHEKYGLWVHSYCLMPNHYHIYLETPNGQLSRIMRQLDGNYTQKFNKNHKRVGPLFQGRYKATIVDRDSYSLELCKYIHRNPAKAKLAKNPEDYKWSSYPAFLGKAQVPGFLKTDWLLSQFHKSGKKARTALKTFTLETKGQAWSPEKETYKGLILGSDDFISQIQDSYISKKSDPEIPALKLTRKQITPEQIEKLVDGLNLNLKARNKLVIYALKKYSQLTLKEIGQRISNLHYSSISQIAKRLQQEAKKDNRLTRLLLKVDRLCNM
ncbi:MAG: transposase [Candidatus Doudnabacteria bacterium]|nr:transposase [Candidatus Doudnabacteria bacterium]